MDEVFQATYNGLNKEQKEAVDTIDGPVMVIAGPGTGKTQVLALRIANIRKKTDTAADSILCLTFTNAGVKAMRERLLRYMGAEATKVKISTFHSFAFSLIEEFYSVLDFDNLPSLLDTASTVVLYDELLHAKQWSYLRPRSNSTMFVHDIQSTFSSLKRDGITPEQLKKSVESEIIAVKDNPASISSRGESKGQLKKEVEKNIESLERTLELSDFYREYEALKLARNVIDYNDVLELLVRLVETSEDARATIREKYLYVLVDEHQDSSGIQNKFLERVWANQETKNVFAVGDDRQLIYGFGGASLFHFESFTHTFKSVKKITLTQNYRSTQTILDMAEHLLQSSLAEGKLLSNTKETYTLRLVESDYARDEIIAAGLDIKKKIAEGVDGNDCAILVPKNRQVKSAIQVLRDMGLPVAATASLQLFELSDTQAFLTVLRSIVSPFNKVEISRTILDPLSGIVPLIGHTFLSQTDTRTLSVQTLLDSGVDSVVAWGTRLNKWLELSQTVDAYSVIQTVAECCLLNGAVSDEQLRQRVEIIRTLLHLALAQAERGSQVDLQSYLAFLDRLQEYDEDIALAVFGADNGVKVLTLHGSKGLEFDAVWIAHMDERSFNATKRQAFTLPASLEKMFGEEDELTKKRELYVALTRAKRFCTISYSRHGYTGADQQLAHIVAALPEKMLERNTATETEEVILNADQKLFVSTSPAPVAYDVTELVRERYKDYNVSVTLLNNFFECPWKWYFRNILQLPESENDALHVGNVVHRVIQIMTDGNGRDEHSNIKDISLREARNSEAYAAYLVKETVPIIENWKREYYINIDRTKDIKAEREWKYIDADFLNLQMKGKVDLYEESGGDVKVTDWKTGKSKTIVEIEKVDEEGRMSGYLRQLTMYSYLINGVSKGRLDVVESRLVFLEAKKGDKHAVYTRRIIADDITRLRKDIDDYMSLIETGEWIARSCNTKTYGENDHCEYCAMAKRFAVAK